MRRSVWMLMPIVVALLPYRASACSYCTLIAQTPTMRQEAAGEAARLILCGTLSNPRIKGDKGGGITDLNVRRVLKIDPTLPKAQQAPVKIELPNYLPVTDARNPPLYVLFCDVAGNAYDPYRAIEIKSTKSADYVATVLQLDRRDARRSLLFFFDHLDDPDPEVAQDAFMEFAKANDHEIGQLAGRLDAVKLRRWLADPKTPPARYGLYSFLLATCGEVKDLPWFEKRLTQPDDRWRPALDGVLGGYIQLKPKEGWEAAARILSDRKQPLITRLAVIRTLQFYQRWQPKESRQPVLAALRTALNEGELADVAIEELRRGAMWEASAAVLAQFNRAGLDAPIYRRAVVRYALSCPEPAAREFIDQVRKTEPNLVRDQEFNLKAIEK